MLIKSVFPLLFLLVFLFGLITGCGQPPKDISYSTKSDEAKMLFLKGLERLDSYHNDEARAFFSKAVKLDPEFAMAYLYWARLTSSPDDLRTHLARAVEFSGKATEPERLIILSSQAEMHDSTARARELLEQMIKILPEGKRAHYILGNYYFGHQDWELAEKSLKNAIDIDESFAPPYNILGYTYVYLEDYPSAIRALKKYSNLIPKEPNPHDSMGEIYLRMGDFENSIKHYHKALKLEPDFIYSYIGLGNNYIFMNKYDKAREAYEELFRRAGSTSDSNTAYYWIAVSYLHENKYEKAVELLEKQLVHAESLSDVYTQASIHSEISYIYCIRGDFDKSLDAASKLREITNQPDIQPIIKETYTRSYLRIETIVNIRLGKSDLALKILKKYKESILTSKNTRLMSSLKGLEGLVAYWQKDFETAIERLEDADPYDQFSKYYLGLCYLKTDRQDKAQKIFSDVASYYNNNMRLALVRPAVLKIL